MIPGPKPKPLEVKQLEGDLHKERWNLNAPKPITSQPTCPAHLCTTAKTEWKRIVPELSTLGILTKIDRAALAAYCEAYGEWVEACRLMKGKSPVIKTAAGNIIQNPLLGIKHKCTEQMYKFLVEFGMTPSSRTRITTEEFDNADDEMAQILGLPIRKN